MLATTAIINQLEELKLSKKAYIVINEVRKPHNKTYKEAKRLIKSNFETIKIASTELSNLTAFRRVFTTSLSGKAKEEIKALISEIEINNIYLHTTN